jgi:hypothetical protein
MRVRNGGFGGVGVLPVFLPQDWPAETPHALTSRKASTRHSPGALVFSQRGRR